jgi:hypothetical protein
LAEYHKSEHHSGTVSALMALACSGLPCDSAPQGLLACGERCGETQAEPLQTRMVLDILAEAVRFELTDPFESPVFKTGAIDHSATLPWGVIVAI